MKKILALVLAGIMLLSFAACGGNKPADEKTVLKVATNAEFEPFESIDSKTQEIVGFDIDLMNAIAEKINVEVKYENMEFDSVVASIPTGTCDLAISGLTINAKRQKSVDFADPYYEGAAQILIVAADDKTFTGTTKEDLDKQLEGKSIGVCSGYTGVAYAEGDEEWGFPGIKDANIKTYDNVSLAIKDLENGTINAIIMDDSTAKEASAANKSTKVIDVPLTIESYGIAVKKGNTELIEKINTALAELKADGTYDKLLETWGLNK